MSPIKEPDFFSRVSLDAVHRPVSGSVRSSGEDTRRDAALQADFEQYLALFDGAGNEKIRGEASAVYLAHPTAAEQIYRYVPDAKLIAILRDPAERAHSHFIHAQRIYAEFERTVPTGRSEKTLREEFMKVVDTAYREGVSEPAMTDPEVWVRSGFYFEHLSRFRSLFAEEQLRVFLFEDLVRDANGLMAEIFHFLDVDGSFILPTTAAFNASVVPRNRGLFRFFTTRNSLMRVARSVAPARVRAAAMRTRNRALGRGKPSIDPDMRRKLVGIYREDIKQLQALLGRDLSAWLDEAPRSY